VVSVGVTRADMFLCEVDLHAGSPGRVVHYNASSASAL
jgi:hypothetical protein